MGMAFLLSQLIRIFSLVCSVHKGSRVWVMRRGWRVVPIGGPFQRGPWRVRGAERRGGRGGGRWRYATGDGLGVGGSARHGWGGSSC